jgi:Urate oxidase N-terminal
VQLLTQGDTGGAVISGIVELLGSVPYSSSLPHRRIPNVAESEVQHEGGNRMNPLTTVKWPLIIGFVLAVAIAALIDGGLSFNTLTVAALTRWLHIIFGVFWIGLLYYFNAVQTPAMAVAAADKGGPGGAGINKYVAPRALLWFRWSALGTWLMGAWLLSQTHGRFVGAFTLGLLDTPVSHPNLIMGIGVWFGTIMLFNVWGLIWPNQKKILGIVPATDEEKAKARKVALYASRTNFLLSIPMLMCMVGPTHGLPF